MISGFSDSRDLWTLVACHPEDQIERSAEVNEMSLPGLCALAIFWDPGANPERTEDEDFHCKRMLGTKHYRSIGDYRCIMIIDVSLVRLLDSH